MSGIKLEYSRIKPYLDEIGRTPLLSRQQEIDLAAKIKKGDEKAFSQFYLANLRLVVKIASGYWEPGLSLWDLISEGNIGLRTAIEKFIPQNGPRFSDYGSLWIKQAVKRASIKQRDPVRLSPKERKRNKSSIIHLDAPIGNEGDTDFGSTFHDLITSANTQNASLLTSSKERSILVEKLFEAIHHPAEHPWILKTGLDQRDLEILRIRFAPTPTPTPGPEVPVKDVTFRKLQARFGCTGSYVQQLHKNALNLLREVLPRINSDFELFVEEMDDDFDAKRASKERHLNNKKIHPLRRPNQIGSHTVYDHTVASIGSRS
jgi:RNA polymerase sigma factor (sigma-70 family)